MLSRTHVSTLTFPGHFTGDIRNVKLDGEGYFAVTKNAKQQIGRAHV